MTKIKNKKYDICIRWRSQTCDSTCTRVPSGHSLAEIITELSQRFKNVIIAHIWLEYQNGDRMFL